MNDTLALLTEYKAATSLMLYCGYGVDISDYTTGSPPRLSFVRSLHIHISRGTLTGHTGPHRPCRPTTL